jgi:hypothetical protein
MNKQQYLFSATLLFSSCFISYVDATPLYYTFEAMIQEPNCGTCCFEDNTGNTLSYVFMVDSEPTVHNIFDFGYFERHYISYNTKLISGTGLIFDENLPQTYPFYSDGSSRFVSNIATHEQGHNLQADFQFGGSARNGYINIYAYRDGFFPASALDSYSDFTQWLSDNITTADWHVILYDSEGNMSYRVGCNPLTLTISDSPMVSSVPEPSILTLMATGVFGIGFVRWFKHKKTGMTNTNV